MDLNLQNLSTLLSQQRFGLQREKELQHEIEQLFIRSGIVYSREYALSKESVIDFLVRDVGIEVKLSSSPKAIYKQCLRYCEFDEVQSIILLTNKIIHLPAALNGKPARVINLGQAWL